MQPRKKSDSPVDSLMNDSTPSPSDFTVFDSPSTSEVPDICKKKQQGFPFIGCLTTFLVLGILGAIALPSLMSCTNKGKQAEAKQNIGAMNRSQQAYYLENNAFSNSLQSLGLGIRTQTTNYVYSTRATKTAAFSYGIARKATKNTKSYVGGVFVVPDTNLDPKADKKEMITVGIVCEAISPSNTRPTDPTLQKGVPTCGSDTKDLISRYK
jgi:type II secretory pathway pseudopilin PulG